MLFDALTFLYFLIFLLHYNLLLLISQHSPNWKINIVSFNDQSSIKSFSDKEKSLEDIKKYVETLNADGYTRLYGTVKDALELLKEKIAIHSTIIVFTDGKNEGTDCNTTQQ
ncbi:VWA domain-containing protein [Rickettsia asembonensis]|uniref:VWA domain-containing protein n=1 Tax=Rickettsia asembonensis TaxID=1068590 RepID=UPI0023F66B26|nr:VWA domain-containing protein [Rickettsia asembonensis]